jgi:hypothetical protein
MRLELIPADFLVEMMIESDCPEDHARSLVRFARTSDIANARIFEWLEWIER